MDNKAIGIVGLTLIPLIIIIIVALVVAAVLAWMFGFSILIGISLMAIALYFFRGQVLNIRSIAFWLFFAGLILTIFSGAGYGFQALDIYVAELFEPTTCYRC